MTKRMTRGLELEAFKLTRMVEDAISTTDELRNATPSQQDLAKKICSSLEKKLLLLVKGLTQDAWLSEFQKARIYGEIRVLYGVIQYLGINTSLIRDRRDQWRALVTLVRNHLYQISATLWKVSS